MNNKSLLFVLLSIVILYYSCHDNSVDLEEPIKSYFPLQIGNEWSFQFPIWTPSSGDTLVTVDYRIIRKKQVNRKEYFALNYTMPSFPSHRIIDGIDTIFIRQNEKGDILLLVDSTEYPYFVFSNTFKINDTNLVRSKVKDVDYYYTTISIDDSVDTPLGQFTRCYIIGNYFPQIKGTEHYIWFAPGYGPVKIYYPELNVTYQLVNINIQN